MSKPVQFLFDYASPWAYLANECLPEKFAGLKIEYIPIYLRGLEAFSTAMPYNANKLKYTWKDFERCIKFHGVEATFPDQFPVNGIHALRGALVAQQQGQFPAYHDHVFKATWRDNRNMGDKEVVIALAAEVGLDAGVFREAINDPEIKETLRQQTEQWQERGVFGVPTFWVGDEMFWGHDRMDYVVRAARQKG